MGYFVIRQEMESWELNFLSVLIKNRLKFFRNGISIFEILPSHRRKSRRLVRIYYLTRETVETGWGATLTEILPLPDPLMHSAIYYNKIKLREHIERLESIYCQARIIVKNISCPYYLDCMNYIAGEIQGDAFVGGKDWFDFVCIGCKYFKQ